jgi:hypothetical protein
MAQNDHAKGASKSLNKTITEIETFLKSKSQHPGPGQQLRPFLHEALADLAEKWLKRGFNRGHKESRRLFFAENKVPVTLRYKGYRELFTGRKRRVRLKSTVRRGAVSP